MTSPQATPPEAIFHASGIAITDTHGVNSDTTVTRTSFGVCSLREQTGGQTGKSLRDYNNPGVIVAVIREDPEVPDSIAAIEAAYKAWLATARIGPYRAHAVGARDCGKGID